MSVGCIRRSSRKSQVELARVGVAANIGARKDLRLDLSGLWSAQWQYRVDAAREKCDTRFVVVQSCIQLAVPVQAHWNVTYFMGNCLRTTHEEHSSMEPGMRSIL